MAGEGPFKGSVFHLDLDNAGSWKEPSLRSHILDSIKKLGGRVDLVYNQDCTHVILRHKEQELYAAAQQLDQSVVSAEYMLKCINEQKLLEETEEGIYEGAEIPGFKEMVAELTQTDFRGMERMVVRYKCECTGAAYSGIMTVPSKTSHLVVKDLASCTEKMEKARRHPQVHIVRADWLDECLKKWRYIPEDEFKLEGQVMESDDDPVDVEPSCKQEDDDNAGSRHCSDLDPTLAIDPDDEETTKAKDEQSHDKEIELSNSQEIKSTVVPSTPPFDLSLDSQGGCSTQQVAQAKCVAGQFASQMNAEPALNANAGDIKAKNAIDSVEGCPAPAPPSQNVSPCTTLEAEDDASVKSKSDDKDAPLELCPATMPIEGDNGVNGFKEEAANENINETTAAKNNEDLVASKALNNGTESVGGATNCFISSPENTAYPDDTNQATPEGDVDSKIQQEEKPRGTRSRGRPRKARRPMEDASIVRTPGKRGRKKKVVLVEEDANEQVSNKEEPAAPIQPKTPLKRKKMAVNKAPVDTGESPTIEETPQKSSKAKMTIPDEAPSPVVGRSGMLQQDKAEPAIRQPANKRKRTSTPVSSLQEGKDHVYSISKMSKTERLEPIKLLKRLGARISAGIPGDPHAYTKSITHLVIGTLVRTEKVMCSLAAGSWILTADFLEQSEQKDSLQDPEKFEHQATDSELLDKGVPKHWRLRHQNLGVGAFDGIKAVFYGSLPAPGNSVLERILVAGGGAVLRRTPPYDGICNAGEANLAVISESKSETRDRHISTLRSAGIVCVHSGYILDWLSSPTTSLSKHKMTVKGKRRDVLSTLEGNRRKGGIFD